MSPTEQFGTRAGRGPEQILVVCTANLIRSPLAAAMLRRSLDARGRDDILVTSAGIRSATGQSLLPETRRVALTRGLDLSGHASREVSSQLVDESALIATMTERQRDHVARCWPRAVSRTFTLIELVRLLETSDTHFQGPSALAQHAHLSRPTTLPPSGPEDVQDPAGSSLRAYERTGERLQYLVEELAHRLNSLKDSRSPSATG